MTLPYEHPKWRQVMGEAFHPGGERLSKRLICLCDFPPGARILDAGCGMGATLGLLVEEGFDALGLDRSDDLLAEAERRGQVVKLSLIHISPGPIRLKPPTRDLPADHASRC